MLELLKKRRTQYALGKQLPISEGQVDELVREAIRHSPSPFNSQSSRAVILFGDESQKLWNIVRETLRAIVPTEQFAVSSGRIDGYAAGAGTVLFFEDQDTIRQMQESWTVYAEQFPTWSDQSGGMAQYVVWLALANNDIGASLQHYNPLIDAEVARTWNLPLSWKLCAQMPFGSNEATLPDKTFITDDIRFHTFR